MIIHLVEIGRLLSSGSLQINIDQTFPLEQLADAQDYVAQGRTRGKVVVTIRD